MAGFPSCLALARQIAISFGPLPPSGTPRADIADGEYDDTPYVQSLLKALRIGMEMAADWHGERVRQTPDAFEQEFHEVSRDTLRLLASQIGEQS